RRPGTRRYKDAGSEVVAQRSVENVQPPAGGALVAYPVLRKIADQDVLNIDHRRLEDPDPVEAGLPAKGSGSTGSVYVEVTQTHRPQRIVWIGRDVDDDPVCAAGKNAGKDLMAVDRDRLGDRDRPEATGIEAIDLAVDERLADGAGKRFVRRAAAPWVGAGGAPRAPRARCLRLSGQAGQQQSERRADHSCA